MNSRTLFSPRLSPLLCLLVGMVLVACNSRSKEPEPAEPASATAPAEKTPEQAVPPTKAARAENSGSGEPSASPANTESASQKTPPPTWLADLASSDAALREAAADKLQQHDQPLTLLLSNLTHAEAPVRRGAAFGLLSDFNARSPKQTAAMQRALADDDEMVRSVALQAVSQWSQADPLAAEAAVPRLEAIVRDSSRDTHERSQAVRILGRLGSAAQPALINSFTHDTDANLRKAALAAAMRTEPTAENIVQPLIGLLNDDSSPALRRQAALHLGEYAQRQPVQQALAGAFTDSSPEVRLQAATSLASGGAAALEQTTSLLADTNPQVRLYAVFTLGKMGSAAEPALPKLRPLTKDSNTNVAKTARGVIKVIEASSP